MAQFTLTYSTLVSTVEDYVEDTSTEFVSALPGCINRAEERLFRDLDLVIWNETVSQSTSSGVATITKSFSESPVQSIWCAANYGVLDPKPRSWIQDLQLGANGVPCCFFEDDTDIILAPTPDSAYPIVITYAKRPTPLSGSQTTNWFSLNAADALLWATLIEAEQFLIAPERVPEFEAAYGKAIGPLRAYWRGVAQNMYEPIDPTPTPTQTR